MSYCESNLERWVERQVHGWGKASAEQVREVLLMIIPDQMHSLRKLPEVTNSITLGRLHVHGIVYDPETEKPYRVSEGEQNH